jgi:hypothetical protein
MIKNTIMGVKDEDDDDDYGRYYCKLQIIILNISP